MLESAGFKAEVSSDGHEGVRLASSHHYDAILMDLQMPGMDGFEATRRIRDAEGSSDRRRTWIVALTANASAEDRERAAAVGMDDFVSKPYSQEQLVAALRRGSIEPRSETEDDPDSTVSSPTSSASTEVCGALDYDTVLRRCNGKRELANRLISRFVGELEDDVARTKSLLTEHAWEEAAQATHKVKGAAAMLGATELRECLEDLERNLRRSASIDVELVAAELERTASDYRVAAETILQDSSRPR
jgi:CheY-like chemotaxis protein/HPt (histidine-containing phosphotransfer) domain-containing protein